MLRASLRLLPVTTLFLACHGGVAEDGRIGRLDEPLRPGQVRAGRVGRASELLGGTTAKGRAGDYKLYNSKIAIVVGEPGASRGYHPYGGTILDADRVRPAGAGGRSTFGEVITALDLSVLSPTRAEVIESGDKGGAARLRLSGEEGPMPFFDAIFSEIFTPVDNDLEWSVDYVLEPDAEWVKIEHTVFNRGKEAIDIGLPIAAFMFGDGAKPFMPGSGFRAASSGAFGDYYGAIADEVSYLYGRPGSPLSVVVSESGIVVTGLGESFRLRGRERMTFVHYLVVGDGDLSRTQAIWDRLAEKGPAPMVTGRVRDAAGRPLAGARVHVVEAEPRDPERDYVSMARTDADGRYTVRLAPGRYAVLAAATGTVRSERVELEFAADRSVSLDLTVPEPGTVRYAVTDGRAVGLPVKLSIRPAGGSAAALPSRYGEPSQSHGLSSTVFAIEGRGTFEVPAGEYDVWVSRGNEYEVAERRVVVAAGEETSFEAVLERSVDTKGWLSTDTHIHAQLSPDSPDLYPLKVASMVTEGLEIPVSTEHESIGDFNPAIRELGLEAWIFGVVGSEVTTMTYGHFNAFPLVADPARPGNGRIEWYYKKPAETFAAIRANAGDPFLQVNHPRATAIGGYLSAMGFQAETGEFDRGDDASLDFDALEVANGCGIGSIEEVTRDWFAFLNRGRRVYATGATDNHQASSGNMGYPRTYVRMPTDEPSAAKVDDIRAAVKAGKMTISCGPFVDMKIGAAEIGDTAEVSGRFTIDALVRAPSWMDVDELEVIVNGAVVRTVPIPETRETERFAAPIEVTLPEGRDGWVILRARGDLNHGVWARHEPSFAFTNPIFLDGNSDGAWVMQ